MQCQDVVDRVVSETEKEVAEPVQQVMLTIPVEESHDPEQGPKSAQRTERKQAYLTKDEISRLSAGTMPMSEIRQLVSQSEIGSQESIPASTAEVRFRMVRTKVPIETEVVRKKCSPIPITGPRFDRPQSPYYSNGLGTGDASKPLFLSQYSELANAFAVLVPFVLLFALGTWYWHALGVLYAHSPLLLCEFGQPRFLDGSFSWEDRPRLSSIRGSGSLAKQLFSWVQNGLSALAINEDAANMGETTDQVQGRTQGLSMVDVSRAVLRLE